MANDTQLYCGMSPTQRLFIVFAVMSATLIQVIDTTIVNVALPHIQGALSANSEQISWILTSYLISSAIFMPLTGYFSDRFGKKNYLLLCIAGFTLSSILCGMAHTLVQMILFRTLQGIFGAGLTPLSQAIMTDIYPKKDLGKAMAIWGVGIMVGPILGPTIGGYLTEYASWHWIFYVNVPVGILALAMAWYFVPTEAKKERAMDWFGFIFASLAIGAAQCFLDRGNQHDWFNSQSIRITFAIAIIAFIVFFINNLRSNKKATVFDLRIFKNANFTLSSTLLVLLGIGLFGNMIMQPLLLENLLNYPVLTTGIVMAPRGISSMIGMMLVGKLCNRINPRWLIIFGIILCVVSSYACATNYSLNIDTWWLIWPFLLQGFGMGMIFVPLAMIAFSTLDPKYRTEAAGIYSLVRTFGSSVGIAITLTIFTRQSQIAWQKLAAFIQPYNAALYHYLQPLHLAPTSPVALSLLSQKLSEQAQVVAYANIFQFFTWAFLIMFPLVFLLKYNQDDVPTTALDFE